MQADSRRTVSSTEETRALSPVGAISVVERPSAGQVWQVGQILEEMTL